MGSSGLDDRVISYSSMTRITQVTHAPENKRRVRVEREQRSHIVLARLIERENSLLLSPPAYVFAATEKEHQAAKERVRERKQKKNSYAGTFVFDQRFVAEDAHVERQESKFTRRKTEKERKRKRKRKQKAERKRKITRKRKSKRKYVSIDSRGTEE